MRTSTRGDRDDDHDRGGRDAGLVGRSAETFDADVGLSPGPGDPRSRHLATTRLSEDGVQN